MKFVTLSGIDGSGKSTQLALLKKYLEEKGRRVAVFNAVEFSLANRIARFLKGKSEFEPGKEKAVTKASWLSVTLREKFLLIDFIRFRFLRRRLERQGVDYLLSDRSFYDSLVNVSYLSGSLLVRAGMFFLEAFLPKADAALYLAVSPEKIMQRDRVPEQGIGYLLAKSSLFDRKIHGWNLTAIDAGRSKESVFQEILELI